MSYPSAPFTAYGEITLREWGQRQWVTHFHNLQDNGYYYGHYFDDLAQAEADFEKRIRKELSPNTELPLVSESSIELANLSKSSRLGQKSKLRYKVQRSSPLSHIS